ncbi:unnamed protein product [Spodoptera exigua]|nr:unnamed protein product [Spodoptera exigua]
MKFLIAFAVLAVGISAVPYSAYYPVDFSDERLVTGAIESAIKDMSQAIKDAGLDPFHIKRESMSYELPVPVLFKIDAFVEEVLSTGLSNIKINRLNYSVLLSRLNFDIELPLVHFSLGDANADAVFFSSDRDFSASGSINVERIRVVGEVRVSIGVISGISVRSLTISFTLNDITSDANLVVFGKDYSDDFNNFVGGVVPDTIKAHYKEINQLLEIVLLEVINDNL